MNRAWIGIGIVIFGLAAFAGRSAHPAWAAAMVRIYSVAQKGYVTVEKVVKTDDEWRRILTPEQFRITRQRGTERSCSGLYWVE